MAVELTAPALQTVPTGQNVLFTNDHVRCNKGYVVHRDGSGIVTLRGIVNGCGGFARYRVTFGANMALPAAATPGEFSLAIAVDGEPLPYTTMSANPATTGRIYNVGRTTYVDVPKGCCVTVAVENISITAAGAAVPVDVSSANLVIERVA